MKLDFSRNIFEELLNVKFHDNSSRWSRAVPRERTDTTKLSGRFSQFCERAQQQRNADR